MAQDLDITLSGPVGLSDIKELAYIYKEIAFSGRLTLYIESGYYDILMNDPEVIRSLVFTWDLSTLTLYGAKIASYNPEAMNANIWRSSTN